ncbi:transposon Tf2-1 polyprotein [Tanacetum coccineum]
MRRDIRNFVRACQICQRAKTSQLHPVGLLSPLPIPNQVLEDVAMDFITDLPNSRGYTVIMVVIDRLSKYAHFTSLHAQFTASQVATLFVQTIVKLRAIPRPTISSTIQHSRPQLVSPRSKLEFGLKMSVGIKSLLNAASITTTHIRVNAAQLFNAAEGVNAASEEVSTAKLVSTVYLNKFDLLKWDQQVVSELVALRNFARRYGSRFCTHGGCIQSFWERIFTKGKREKPSMGMERA